MAIDSEPKNGDFARYIENLTRAGGATPGQVSGQREASRRASAPVAAPVPTATSESLSTAPWGKAAPPPMQSMPGVSVPGQEDAGAVSMARRARQRKIGIVLTIGGMLAGWAAVRIAFEAMRHSDYNLDTLMPAIFLALFAFMLFKAGSGARNPRKSRLETLPPLKPSSHRKDAS
ncbi:hypothetical protein [Achromobacter deleyi]|uniref:hypothetical protein n=1 Tax=Achromobacter deleyi TaxID=1353891 RepID=UPI001491E212|nr:hypothetical protein [Achromobacter deleyi]QVQ27520.1 hypothetical protein HLG70_03450 [Achromobacter deleyi]UIP23114.1 hypothetical protein LYZ39_11560 [Achromobacter deleyi]